VTRLGLIAKLSEPALGTMTEAAEWLAARGCTPILDRAAAGAAGLAARWPTADRRDLAAQVDAILVFGGDGTLLEAANAVAASSHDVPMLGINLGRLGFLTEVGRDGMAEAFEAMLAGRTAVEHRLMLAGQVVRMGAVAAEHTALNDIVVTRGALSRIIEVDVEVDGNAVWNVKADGLIVATATGSTAYNLSAGGPIVHPGVDAFVLTPIAPHTLSNRPLVLPATLALVLRPRFEPMSDIVVTFDGQLGTALEAGDVVRVSRSPRQLRLMRIPTRTHFDMLREKLRWGR
jgi:NAD+ kinase